MSGWLDVGQFVAYGIAAGLTVRAVAAGLGSLFHLALAIARGV